MPPWIKSWTRELSDQRYLNLSLAERGLLADIAREYGRSLRYLPANTEVLSRRFNARVTKKMLDSLNHAGFITISASKPASTPAGKPASPDRDGDRDTPLPPYGDARKPRPKPKRERIPFSAQNGTAPDELLCPRCHTGAGYHTIDCASLAEPVTVKAMGSDEEVTISPFDDTAPDQDAELEYADFGAILGDTT